jgi:hypothetical protein
MIIEEEGDLKPWSEEERSEYVELGSWCRHDDSIIYQAAAVFLPLSFGSVAVAYQFPSARFGLLFFSLSVYLYWLLICVRISWLSAVRLERARELEDRANLHHYKMLTSPPVELGKGLGGKLSVRKLRLLFLWVLVLLWLTTLYTLSGEPKSGVNGEKLTQVIEGRPSQ